MNNHQSPPELPKSSLTNGSNPAKSDWDDPVDIERPKLPEFPIEGFRGDLGHWILAASYAYQTPVELAALLSLAAVSGMIQRRVQVLAGESWIEPVNLYVACVLEPGSRKSAVFAEAFRPIREIEADLIDAAKPEIARSASERRIKEKELAGLETKGAKGCSESIAAAEKLAVDLAINPPLVQPKLILDDTSPEAAEMALVQQSGRLIVAGAEGGIFDVMGGRYSGSVNLDVFLKSHSGDDLRVDRLGREAFIQRPSLTLAYAIQSQVIQGLADKPAFRGRGLLARFLYAVPKSNLGSRLIDTQGIPGELRDAYDRLFQRLVHLKYSDDVETLVLSADAYGLFLDWRYQVESMLADDGRLASMRDWGGKLCGLAARLAAVLHVARSESSEPWNVPIDCETIQLAIEIGNWSIDHAEAAIGLMAADDGSVDDAADALRFIRSERKPQVSRREIHVNARSRFDGDRERLNRCLDRLVDYGWLRSADVEKKIGRPSEVYDVHPKIWM
jgi:hypothetical protein